MNTILEIKEDNKLTTIQGIVGSGKSTILKALFKVKMINPGTHMYFSSEESANMIYDILGEEAVIVTVESFKKIQDLLECVLYRKDIKTIAIDCLDSLSGDYTSFYEWLQEYAKRDNIKNVYITLQMRRNNIY